MRNEKGKDGINHPAASSGVLTALLRFVSFQPAFVPRDGELNLRRLKVSNMPDSRPNPAIVLIADRATNQVLAPLASLIVPVFRINEPGVLRRAGAKYVIEFLQAPSIYHY